MNVVITIMNSIDINIGKSRYWSIVDFIILIFESVVLYIDGSFLGVIRDVVAHNTGCCVHV